MKIIIPLFIIVLINSSCKPKIINHYLTDKVTSQELVKNGFYKYSYTETINDDDNDGAVAKKNQKYYIYSNIKPEKDKEGFRPMNVARFRNQDSIHTKESDDFLRDILQYRTLIYVFRNDTLLYKNINTLYPQVKNKFEDFTTLKKIRKYCDSLKIPLRPIIDNEFSTEENPSLFLINDRKVLMFFNYYGYDMLINYSNSKMPDWDIVDKWYRESKFSK